MLLVRRAIALRRGHWDLPGGFLEADEHPAAGVARELREETGLDIAVTGLLGSYMDRYDTPDGPVDTLNVVYLAAAPQGEPRPADDAAAIGWFAPDELPADLAFPHQRAVFRGWQRQQGSAAPNAAGTETS